MSFIIHSTLLFALEELHERRSNLSKTSAHTQTWTSCCATRASSRWRPSRNISSSSPRSSLSARPRSSTLPCRALSHMPTCSMCTPSFSSSTRPPLLTWVPLLRHTRKTTCVWTRRMQIWTAHAVLTRVWPTMLILLSLTQAKPAWHS